MKAKNNTNDWIKFIKGSQFFDQGIKDKAVYQHERNSLDQKAKKDPEVLKELKVSISLVYRVNVAFDGDYLSNLHSIALPELNTISICKVYLIREGGCGIGDNGVKEISGGHWPKITYLSLSIICGMLS